MVREHWLVRGRRSAGGAAPPSHLGQRPTLDDAYALAREITRAASKSFYLSTLLLPRPKRQAIQALYAFLRTTDDIIDEGGDGATLIALERWRARSRRPAARQDHPVLLAWADTRDRYGMPQALAEELIDGVAMDLTISRYTSFAELERYCYCVASTVGLMSIYILGCEGGGRAMDEATPYATRLGLAMQLTNVLRDVGEDARAGRIYLPLDELGAAGYSEAELLAGAITPAFRRFLDEQIARADGLYDASLPGITFLRADSRFAVAAAAATYRGILPKIVANGYDVFDRRAHLTLREKLLLLPPAWRRRPPTTRGAVRGEYLALLLISLGAIAILDRVAELGVFRQGRRLALALGPTAAVILAWDLLGVERWGWSSNEAVLLGPYGLGGRIPLEELLFPVVVGCCALVLWELIGKRLAERQGREGARGGRRGGDRREEVSS
jgi:phytoene synthase